MEYVPTDRFISTSFTVSHQSVWLETCTHWILQKSPCSLTFLFTF